MSRSTSSRKPNLKTVPAVKEPSGPLLKFQWSTLASHLVLLEDNRSVTLPSIDKSRSQRKIFTDSRSTTDQSVISHLSRSTCKSLPLPNVANQSRPTRLTKQETSSPSNSPLLLNYAQLHKKSSSPSLLLRSSRQSHLSIHPISNDKKSNLSMISEKISLTSRSSISSTTKISSLPSKAYCGLPNDNFVRLNTPQLRHLHVSEKYINEAKKLYFNADCKIFVPYTPSTAVF